MKTRIRLLCMVCAVLGFSTANGQSTWTGSVDNNYNTAGNWSPSGVPGFGTSIEINSGTPTFNGTDSFFERGSTTTINGGDLEVNNARFLNGRGGAAVFNVQSGSVTQNSSTYFIVSQNNTGTFNQSGGLVDLTIGRGFFLTDGGGTGGTYNLTGGTLDVKLNRYASDALTNELFNGWVGRGGNNDLMRVDGGTFNLDVTGPAGADRNFLVARNATFRVDSGIVDMQGLRSFTVGQARVANTTSIMLINGGTTTLAVQDALVIGSGVSGSMTMTDGTLTVNQDTSQGGELRLGDVSTSDSVATAGKSAVTTSEVLLDGGTMDIAGNITLGVDANNTSTFTMNDGFLFASDILTGSGSSSFLFNGGQIQLAGDRTDLLSESWFTGASGTFATFDGVNTTIAIPEPGTLLLVGLVLGALGLTHRHKRIK